MGIQVSINYIYEMRYRGGADKLILNDGFDYENRITVKLDDDEKRVQFNQSIEDEESILEEISFTQIVNVVMLSAKEIVNLVKADKLIVHGAMSQEFEENATSNTQRYIVIEYTDVNPYDEPRAILLVNNSNTWPTYSIVSDLKKALSK